MKHVSLLITLSFCLFAATNIGACAQQPTGADSNDGVETPVRLAALPPRVTNLEHREFCVFQRPTEADSHDGAEAPVRLAALPPWKEGLSDKALAMQRAFSEMTFLSDRSDKNWKGWYDDGKQFGLDALRYQLAFAGYGCAAAAAKTPAYRELVERQLHDLCERIIDVRVWPYVASYWDYGDTTPDPCLYENVMYTGHMTHLMCLYEHLTGDQRYSTDGWNFVWKDARKTHYTLEKAIQRLHVQSVANPSGGICCEPKMIFVVCNSHSSISFMMHDLLHGTEYSKVNQKWFDWLRRRFRNTNALDSSRSFFYMVYQTEVNLFLPVGDVGNDGWALGWGNPWFPDEAFAKQGWKFVRHFATWKKGLREEKKECKCHAKSNPATQCCGIDSTIVSNSFVPLVAVQNEGKDSEIAKQIIHWLDEQCGRQVDLDGDSHAESFLYKAPQGYETPVTGNILAALTTDGDAMRKFYRTSRKELLTQPTLAHVDYPNHYVRAAEYRNGTLRFVILKGNPSFSGQTELICTNIPQKPKVYRDGKPFDNFRYENGKLTITTTIENETVFEVITEND